MLSPRLTQRASAVALAATLGLFPVCALADEPQAQAPAVESAAVATQAQEEPAAEKAAPTQNATSTANATVTEPKPQDAVAPEESQQQEPEPQPQEPAAQEQEPQQTTAQTGEKAGEKAEESVATGTNADATASTVTEPSATSTDAVATEAPAETSVAATSEEPASTAATTAATTTAATSQPPVKMYRIYNQWSGEHLFTSSIDEVRTNVALGWTDEGLGWEAPQSSGTPVYRLYNPYSGDHHYTTSEDEYNQLGALGWSQEGIGFYSSGNEGLAVYRLFNPYVTIGTHHYTLSKDEYQYLGTIGWSREGIGWYAVDSTSCTITASFGDGAGSTESTVSTNKDGVTYVVLPSYANASSVALSFSGNGSAVGAQLSLPAGTASVAAAGSTVDLSSALGSTINYSTNLGTHPLVILKSGKVGTIFVTSVDPGQDRAWVEASPDHSAKANVNITMISSDGSPIYNKDGEKHSTIKGRGNNTWGLGEKKPYQISLSKKADLLQTGNSDNANKKWVLLANENDATLLHDTVAYDMGLELGMVGTEGTPVDLYYDGEYRGSYYLCEKVEIKDGRIDIHNLEDDVEKANKGTDLSSAKTAQETYTHNGKKYTYQYAIGVKDPKDITGGYLVEKDGAYYAKETCWFNTSIGIFVVKSPEVASQSQVLYIAEQFQTAIDAMQNNQFNLTDQASFDLDSLAKSYLVNEFTKNIDFFFTSTYFYKDKGSNVIYAEPLWDFDGSMGIRTDGSGANFNKYSGYSVPGGEYLYNIPSIWTRAQEIWKQQLSPLMANAVLGGTGAVGSNGYLHSLAYYRNQISASQVANQAIFGMSHFRNEFAPFPTYEQNYQYLVDWLTWRTEWFNKYFANAAKPENHTSNYNGTDYGLVYDYNYYVENHPEVTANVGTDANTVLAYFVQNDMPRGVRASLNFDPATYKARYADLIAAFGDNWASYYEHYMTYGFYEGRTAI